MLNINIKKLEIKTNEKKLVDISFEIKDSKELEEVNHHLIRSWIVFLSESDL